MAFVASILAITVFEAEAKPADPVAEAIDRLTAVLTNTATQGPQGEQGEQGPQGEQGEQGETGPSGSMTVYEVSAVSLIRADERNGNEVQLRCLEGDRFLNDKPILRLTIPQGILPDTFDIGFKSSSTREIFEFQPLIGGAHVIIIGYDTTPFADGLNPPIDIPVTVTGICLSPSS